MRKGIGILLVVCLLIFNAITCGQCAMCKANIETSPQGQKMARNLNNAILLLLCAPYVVFGTTAYIIYKKQKSNNY